MIETGNRNGSPSHRLLAPVALAVVAVFAAACTSSGPVDDVFLFEGQVAYQGSDSHLLVTDDQGIARFEVVSLIPRLIDATAGSTITIGLRIGEPTSDGCSALFSTTARVGNVFPVGLEEKTDYCVEVFDPGSLPEDALVDYTVSVTPG